MSIDLRLNYGTTAKKRKKNGRTWRSNNQFSFVMKQDDPIVLHFGDGWTSDGHQAGHFKQSKTDEHDTLAC